MKDKTYTFNRNTIFSVSAGFVLMVAGAAWTVAINVQAFQSRLERNTQDITILYQKAAQLSSDSVDAKVQLSEIQTQLKNIDTNILDLKTQLLSREK